VFSPLVDALKIWLEGELARVSGKSVIATAIRYGLKHWDGPVGGIPWFSVQLIIGQDDGSRRH
jgi:hypothetical protein